MDKQIILLSFADSRYTASLNRLFNSTKDFPFTQRILLTENNLPDSFLKTVRYKMHRRGYGYWKWKPYVVARQLEKMNEGDILFYSDAGCYWNIKGLKRFNYYLEKVEQSETGMLAFEHPFLEKDWTKGDLLDFFGVYDDTSYTMTLQYASGLFALKKCSHSVKLVDQWNAIYKDHYDLVTDKKSLKPNLLGFCENRHDQSVLSLLFKKYGCSFISWREIETLDNIYCDNMDCFPIQCRRLMKKDQSIFMVILHKISIPYRLVIGFWLKYVEGFCFFNRCTF